jgi:hypothetical protein
MLTPETAFQAANVLAIAGWLVLALGVVLNAKVLRVAIAGRLVPLLLALAYASVLVTNWPGGDMEGFSSLAGIASLFSSPWLLVAGWLHYLAFDLFIGAWAAQDASERGAPRALLIPVLPAILFAGPIGLALWLVLRQFPVARPVSAK